MGRFSNLEFNEEKPLRQEGVGSAPESRDEHFYLRLGDEHFRGARFEKALRYYSRALEFNVNGHAAWVGQAQMLVELGEFKEARLWADKALEVHRDHPELLSVKSTAWAREGDTKRGVEFSDAAMTKRPTTPPVWLARGEALLADRQANDDHCFERAQAESKRDWFMAVRIARILRFHGQFARALAWAQRAMSLDAAQPIVWAISGECQAALGLGAQAQRSYEQVLGLDRDFPGARASFEALRTRGPWDRLRDWFRARFSGKEKSR